MHRFGTTTCCCFWAFLVSLTVSTSAVRAFAAAATSQKSSLPLRMSSKMRPRRDTSLSSSLSPTATTANWWLLRGGGATANACCDSHGGGFTVVLNAATTVGRWYGEQLHHRPILTKSVTAGIIFTLSDYLAQRLEQRQQEQGSENRRPSRALTLNKTRLISGGLVGLLYFGPAAHYWYDTIFRLFPATSLVSTLQKAALGQVLFGPSFTCLFFAVGLAQSGQFTVGNWIRKIQTDLPRAWLAGSSFWPLVDILSYSVIPKTYIPLFINLCSLVWNVYLSWIANRSSSSGGGSSTTKTSSA